MKANKQLQVFCQDQMVGTLALTGDRKVAFEYGDEWLEHGFSINPFSLPLKKQVFIPTRLYFQGLFGVFADSLPDAWGNILLNRLLKRQEIDTTAITTLDRLSIVGNAGMGALIYKPETTLPAAEKDLDLDKLATQCQHILTTEFAENLDELYKLGGTSGGARPKIMTRIDGEEWIIKFPAHVDGRDAGIMEYQYSVCARKCGIQMTETRLFPSQICKGYFGIKRFDRNNQDRIHMCTASGLLELNFEEPSLDYHSLMKLTKILTRDNPQDVENMYRRMCFNVLAHNRDDHGKNFTYLYNREEDMWQLSPAYDLTYSNTYFGEHTTSVDGNGKNPGRKEIMNVGTAAGLSRGKCHSIYAEIRDCVKAELGQYCKVN